jgi:hypothetical protein
LCSAAQSGFWFGGGGEVPKNLPWSPLCFFSKFFQIFGQKRKVFSIFSTKFIKKNSPYSFSRWRRENFLLKSSNEVKKPAPQAKIFLQNACF